MVPSKRDRKGLGPTPRVWRAELFREHPVRTMAIRLQYWRASTARRTTRGIAYDSVDVLRPLQPCPRSSNQNQEVGVASERRSARVDGLGNGPFSRVPFSYQPFLARVATRFLIAPYWVVTLTASPTIGPFRAIAGEGGGAGSGGRADAGIPSWPFPQPQTPRYPLFFRSPPSPLFFNAPTPPI